MFEEAENTLKEAAEEIRGKLPTAKMIEKEDIDEAENTLMGTAEKSLDLIVSPEDVQREMMEKAEEKLLDVAKHALVTMAEKTIDPPKEILETVKETTEKIQITGKGLLETAETLLETTEDALIETAETLIETTEDALIETAESALVDTAEKVLIEAAEHTVIGGKIMAQVKERRRKFKEAGRLMQFCLVDVRTLFIIIAVYTTVVLLISTTASNEATRDANSNKSFDLTSRPEHANVKVAQITDAVLWNCREKSVTSHYYRSLYLLLFVAFSVIMLVFLITRMTVTFGWKHRLGNNLHNLLWQMAIIQRLKEIVREHGSNDNFTDQKAQLYQDQWNTSKKVVIPWTLSSIPYFEAVFLVLNLPFILTSYNLHPLSCVVGPDDYSIEYFNDTQTVELTFSSYMRFYQIFAGSVSLVLMIPLVLLAVILYCNYKSIIKNMIVEMDKIDTPEELTPASPGAAPDTFVLATIKDHTPPPAGELKRLYKSTYV